MGDFCYLGFAIPNPDKQDLQSAILISTTEIEHDENVTQWDDYNSEILPYKFGTSYPEKPGQVMTIKKQL
jgi:hypothetical protein